MTAIVESETDKIKFVGKNYVNCIRFIVAEIEKRKGRMNPTNESIIKNAAVGRFPNENVNQAYIYAIKIRKMMLDKAKESVT